MKKSEQLRLSRKNNDRAHWIRKPIMAGELTPWLVNEGSLTKHLQHRYLDFHVRPLVVAHAKPLIDERAMLCLHGAQRAFVREVLLYGNNAPVIFAHSVMALKHLRGSWAGLETLGKQPLGATLFAKKNIKRTTLAYQKLSPNSHLGKNTWRQMHAIGLLKPTGAVWARRSIFSLHRKVHQQPMRIMVTEVFLPTLLENVTGSKEKPSG